MFGFVSLHGIVAQGGNVAPGPLVVRLSFIYTKCIFFILKKIK